MANQREKKMEHEMVTGVLGCKRVLEGSYTGLLLRYVNSDTIMGIHSK